MGREGVDAHLSVSAACSGPLWATADRVVLLSSLSEWTEKLFFLGISRD